MTGNRGRAASDTGAGQAVPTWAGSGLYRISTLRLAIALAVIGIVVTSLALPAHVRGGVFPWWLIPLGFLLCRRLVGGSYRRTRRDSTL